MLLSDHMPFNVRSKELSCISWNILCRMKFHVMGDYFNNGFQCVHESLEEYTYRLKHLAARLTTLTLTERPDFICLQETPNDTLFFLKMLHFDDLSYWVNTTNACSLITLSTKRRYLLINELSQELSYIKLNQGLKDRIHSLVFINKETNHFFLLVNVHAGFSKEIKQDIDVLYGRAIELKIKGFVAKIFTVTHWINAGRVYAASP